MFLAQDWYSYAGVWICVGIAVPAHLQLAQESFTWGWHLEMPSVDLKINV